MFYILFIFCFFSKANTVLQLALVGCSLAAPVFGFVDHPHLQYLWWVTFLHCNFTSREFSKSSVSTQRYRIRWSSATWGPCVFTELLCGITLYCMVTLSGQPRRDFQR